MWGINQVALTRLVTHIVGQGVDRDRSSRRYTEHGKSSSVVAVRNDGGNDQQHEGHAGWGVHGALMFSASHAARCVACHGVRPHPVPVALVGECSIPVV